ncbi:MAG: hypothetical protein J6K51_01720 [Clostridia bacterium]|nr:hypothetical protein [Clostridia bacterium]
MTDNEIIEAFEYLVKNADNHIPITGKMLLEDVLGVLNRQKEDNEQYKKVNILIAQQRDERDKNIAELEAKIERLNEKYSRMKFNLESVLAERADHTEVIKEFTSRIEGVLSLHPAQAKYYYEIKKEYIKENQNDQ